MSDLTEIGLNAMAHAGVKFRSGRYPWGSGERPHQHDDIFMFDNGETDYREVNKYFNSVSSAVSSGQKVLGDVGKLIDPNNRPPEKRDYRSQARNMTDEELRSVINRINLEKQYNQLMNEQNPPRRSKSDTIISNVLKYGPPALSLVGSGIAVATALTDMKAKKQEAMLNEYRLNEKNKFFNQFPETAWQDEMDYNTFMKKTKARNNMMQQWNAYLGIKNDEKKDK